MREFLLRFFKGHERTVKAKKNIFFSFLIKGMSMVVGFLIVRITLDYLDKTTYGIWLTLTSFLTWFSFFEIGLGNGLKNKLAEALADKNYELGKIYVSTTYAILAVVVVLLAIVFFIGNVFIDWTIVLNTDKNLINELSAVALIVFGFFFLRFVIKLISTVLYADQRPAIANAFGPIGNLLSLIIIYILTKTTEGNLIYLSWVYSVVPVIVLIVVSIYFYKNEYRRIAPSIKSIKFHYAKDLLNLGVIFFLIQIAGLIIYQSTNIIIAQYFGPSEVTVYNIGYKYFSIMAMIFTIIVSPFWSAYTEAWVKNDMKWIKNTVKKLLLIWVGISIIGVIMLIFADPFYHLWIGNEIIIPFKLSLVLFIYFMTFTFGNVYVTFLNGIGKIKLQMYAAFFGVSLFLLSAFVLIKYFNFGIIGLVIASIISNFYGLILAPIQYSKIVNKKAKGIWDK
ncbi:polysaccharide biosynthesis protein [Aureibaculum algae]|uniref:Polysaccharide biosynthesis protein n=1 Tax=Aureibaculum algae TaxID=2584122 RepID=A0A5B7TV40_9FLAO|nr:MATE family efflux transporter [Aureibaculum algae]QCX39134.1 polysaccharide biosynthesis protein [Aureibaculum algae]